MGFAASLATAALLAAAGPTLAQDAGPCRQALALGLDVSGSVDGGEYRLQLDGLASALTHPDVIQALLSAAATPVKLAIYEWSGPTSQAMIVDWTAITDTAVLAQIATRLEAHRRSPADPATALGTALVVGGQLLGQQPECWKRTLDISGDGESNTGPRPQDLAGAPDLTGITVNALVVGPEAIDPPEGGAGLLGYFETYVIRGPGAFAEHAEDFTVYEAAMVRKLLKELQGMVVGAADPGPVPPALAARMTAWPSAPAAARAARHLTD